MANLANIRVEKGWLADKIALNRHATYMLVGDFGNIHGLHFDLPTFRAQINRMHEENGVEKGYFHVASLAYGLKVLLLGFTWSSL